MTAAAGPGGAVHPDSGKILAALPLKTPPPGSVPYAAAQADPARVFYILKEAGDPDQGTAELRC